MRTILNRFPLIFLPIILLACSQSIDEKKFDIFNEGVALTLDANALFEQNDVEVAKEKHLLAIKKFKQILKLDSNDNLAPGAIAMSYYEIKEFRIAQNWFQKAIKKDSSFAVYQQYLGLSQINLGQIDLGKQSIDKAFKIDNSESIRTNTIDNLVTIGTLANTYAKTYKKEGSITKGEDYEKFAIGTLVLAFEYSSGNKNIGNTLLDWAKKENDLSLIKWIKEYKSK